MDISSLYEFPVLPNGTGTYDASKPAKWWSRPLQSGENPNDFIRFQTVQPTDNTNTAVSVVSFAMTKLDAFLTNVPTAGNYPESTSGAAVPVPLDMTKMPPNSVFAPNPLAAFGGLPLIEPSTPAPPAPTPGTDAQTRILAGVNALLKFFGQPTV